MLDFKREIYAAFLPILRLKSRADNLAFVRNALIRSTTLSLFIITHPHNVIIKEIRERDILYYL